MPFPPLEFDLEERKIKGSFEMRLTDAEGFPGDVVTVTLQVRAGRPVNWMIFFVHWDGLAIHALEIEPLYPDPTLGEVRPDEYGEYSYHVWNGSSLSGFRGQVEFTYMAERNLTDSLPSATNHNQPSLRYLAPLGEWLDLARLTFEIVEDRTGSGETPVWLDLQRRSAFPAQFLPYYENPQLQCLYQSTFKYEPVETTPGRVIILGGGGPRPRPEPPVDPEVAGITLEVGSAAGGPGDEVSLPVSMETAVDLFLLRLALGYDPDQLELLGFDASLVDPRGDPARAPMTAEEHGFLNRVCESPPAGELNCEYGFPLLGTLHGEWAGDEVPRGALIVDIAAPYDTVAVVDPIPRLWSAGESYELGSVRFRIREEARAGQVEITGVAVNWKPQGSFVEVPTETGGYPVLDPPPEERADVPALEVLSGTVTITSERTLFIRGDADLSGDIVITDPVRTFRTLFQGDPPLPCDDSADANDDGSVDITDAIYTLQWLFLGGPEPPPPYPDPGLDTTEDALDCAEP